MKTEFPEHYIRMDGKIWRCIGETHFDPDPWGLRAFNYEPTDLPLDTPVEAVYDTPQDEGGGAGEEDDE